MNSITVLMWKKCVNPAETPANVRDSLSVGCAFVKQSDSEDRELDKKRAESLPVLYWG